VPKRALPLPSAAGARRSKRLSDDDQIELSIMPVAPAPGVDREQLRREFIQYLARQLAREIVAEL
jgi:hypothetical protein